MSMRSNRLTGAKGKTQKEQSREYRQCHLGKRSDAKCCRYVKTSDGTKRVFQPGEVMFQDNVKDSPADKQPEHESGKVSHCNNSKCLPVTNVRTYYKWA